MFPEVHLADQDGLVAVGGDFSTSRLVQAYRRGIFPWSVNPITWWSPDPRGIIELHHLHVPRSLRRVLRCPEFTVSVDRAFGEVLSACARPAPGRESTWITREFISAYNDLHRAGHAHSLEIWRKDELVGGIYGVSQGGLFAGESMFHRVSNASKLAVVRLVEHLKSRGFVLFDVQMLTPVTRQLGGREIPRPEYLQRLAQALELECVFSETPVSMNHHDTEGKLD
jgi:leucyl/phenylalanyl-tRNA--protein transferase